MSDKLFELAKEITKPRNDGYKLGEPIHDELDATSVLFIELHNDLKFAVRNGALKDIESRIAMVLFKYEKHFRRMLEIQKGLD